MLVQNLSSTTTCYTPLTKLTTKPNVYKVTFEIVLNRIFKKKMQPCSIVVNDKIIFSLKFTNAITIKKNEHFEKVQLFDRLMFNIEYKRF